MAFVTFAFAAFEAKTVEAVVEMAAVIAIVENFMVVVVVRCRKYDGSTYAVVML